MSMTHTIRLAWIKAGQIEGWEPCIFQRVGPDATLMRGGIPRLLKKGKRKGCKTWDEIGDPVVVTDAETQLLETQYERETGKCSTCDGEGKCLASWSVEHGTTYATCRKCKGSGKAEGEIAR